MKEKKLVYLSIIFETSALYFHFTHEHNIYYLLLFYGLHAVASALLSSAIVLISPRFLNLKFNRIFLFILFFSFIFILSFPGFFLTFVILIYLVVIKARTKPKIKSLLIDYIPKKELSMARKLPPSTNIKRIVDLSSQRALEVITALEYYQNPSSLSFLHELTRSEHDEIRLLSVSLKEKFQTELTKKIKKLEDLVKEDPNNAEYILDLVFSYWNLLYFNLVDKELEGFFLEKIEDLLKKAEALKPDDFRIFYLRGRTNLRYGRLPEARRAFYRLLKNKSQKERVLPYLAELAFNEGDFQGCLEYIKQSRHMKRHPVLSIIYRLWTRNGQ